MPLEALSKIIADALKQPGSFVEKPMERDVIVVTGKFAYHELTEAITQPTRLHGPNPVYLFRGKFDPQAVRGGGTCDLNNMMEHIGTECDRPVVIETALPADMLVSWRNYATSTTSARTPEQVNARVDEVLANVMKQTSLVFKRDRRMVPTWTWQNGK